MALKTICLEVALKASALRRGRYKIADSGVLKFKRFKGEKRKARGCKIEHEIAVEYGLEVIYEYVL